MCSRFKGKHQCWRTPTLWDGCSPVNPYFQNTIFSELPFLGAPLEGCFRSLYFLNGSLDNLVKDSGENGFYYQSQELEANILDIVKEKKLFPFTIGIALKNPRKIYLPRMDFIILELIVQWIDLDKNYEHFLDVWKALEMKILKDLYLEVDTFLLACMLEFFRKKSINAFELGPSHYFFTLAVLRM